MSLPIGIVGLGAYTPERVMTNAEWSRRVETTEEWIRARTGIERRRFAADDETTVDLAEQAARRALADAGLTAADIDEIVVATDTPEVYIPDTSAFLQHRLGAREVPAYDLAGSGCAGFLQALDVALVRARTRRGAPRRILVVAVELLSRLMNWEDRTTCVLFGDAAGAAVVGPGEGAARCLAATAGTDGSRAGILTLETGGTRRPFSLEAARQGLHKDIVMEGRAVFRDAVTRMTAAARAVLDEAGIDLSEVALVVPHQANARILASVAQHLDLPEERLFSNVAEYGNTGSASIPLALCQAREQGRIAAGDLVLLTAFGAGFHWGAMLLRF
ncbi:MAG TPA: beta-ketoacyl-ACP synthase III [Thermoanaerobaculia bacterium]|nr:beta-ketoacyl-ACP synthase III [Thermoanaerobaculia bacterium]